MTINEAMPEPSVISVRGVTKTFDTKRDIFNLGKKGCIHALQGISFNILKGECLGIVGESGCGKTTLARILAGLEIPSTGDIVYQVGTGKIQYVFQNPQASLNPRKTIHQIINQPLLHKQKLKGHAADKIIDKLLAAVQLPDTVLERYPHEFSGGQAQRIVLARALAANPEIVVLDEPVSALDVSVQAQILNLLMQLKKNQQLTFVFISHDMSVIKRMSDRVLIMYFGTVVEQGDCNVVFTKTRHPYTKMLLESIPRIGHKTNTLIRNSSELPDPANPPQGCAFAERCVNRLERCSREKPALTAYSSDHHVACFNPIDAS